jgi:hypothetical protein
LEREKRDITGKGKMGPFTFTWITQKSWWWQNPRKNRSEKSRMPFSSTVFSDLSPRTFGSLEWRRKNEGSRISHSSRYSPPFDGDLEWSHFPKCPIWVPWVENPPELNHGEPRSMLFWIKQNKWRFIQWRCSGHLIGTAFWTLSIIHWHREVRVSVLNHFLE